MLCCSSARPILSPALVPVRKAADSALTEIERLARRLEPQLARTILAGLTAMGDRVDLDEIIRALETGDIARVLAVLGIEQEGSFLSLQALLMDAVFAGAGIATTAIRLSNATFGFNRLNPRLISWLQTYHLGLIREIGTSTKEAVRTLLIDGMTRGQNPRQTAVRIKEAVGLTERQARAVGNFRTELETFHLRRNGGGYRLGSRIDRVNGFQVLRPDSDGKPLDGISERRLRDFRFDGQLKRAVETGKPLTAAQIDKMVAAYRRKYLAFRARTIARTEALRATNVGVQDAWRQAIEAGKIAETQVRRMWIVARDERLCSVCAPIPGLNPKRGVKFDQPFATPNGPWNLPPIHPNCRCTIFIRQYEPSQLIDEATR